MTPEQLGRDPVSPHLLSHLQRHDEELYCGLNKRELFAAMALGGWIQALGQRRHEAGYSDIAAVYEAASLAVSAADALLSELARAAK